MRFSSVATVNKAHRLGAGDVVEHEQMGMCPDEICSVHPSLTLAEVHAALAYYFDHREEIQADLQADEAYLQESMQRAPDNMGTA